MRPKGEARRGQPWRADAATAAGGGHQRDEPLTASTASARGVVEGLRGGRGRKGRAPWRGLGEKEDATTPAAAVAGGERPRSSLEMIFSELGAQWRAILAGARASISLYQILVWGGGGPGAHMSAPIVRIAGELIF